MIWNEFLSPAEVAVESLRESGRRVEVQSDTQKQLNQVAMGWVLF